MAVVWISTFMICLAIFGAFALAVEAERNEYE